MPEWKGVISSIIMPLKNEGNAIDLEAMCEYCERLRLSRTLLGSIPRL